MVFTASLLDARYERESVDKSWQVRFLCPWVKQITDSVNLYVEDNSWDQAV